MSKTTPSNDPSSFTLPDPIKLMDNLSKALQIGASLAQRMAERQQEDAQNADPEAAMKPVEPIFKTFTEIAQSYAQHPERWAEASWQLWQGYAQLMQNTWARMLGEHPDPVISPERSDKRFKDPDWSNNQMFDFFKQAYLLTARWAHDTISASEDVDDATRHRARFYFDQIANAMAPSNFAFTNPEVLKQTLASSGQNLVDGMTNLARDIEAGQGSLKITQTDMSAFALGENMALTPGHRGLSERPDAAHSVCAHHRESARGAAAHRAAVDQQVLHSRPQPQEVVYLVVRGQGADRLRYLLGQPGCAPRREGFCRLHARRHSRGADPDREADRPEAGQHHRLLHRRHAAGLNAGLHGGQGR
jgi:hypothetical protein